MDFNKKFIRKDLGIGELKPGATKRRWEQSSFMKNKIRRESKRSDAVSNLPFTFSKPKKAGRQRYFECSNCGNGLFSGVNTVGVICSECNKYCSVVGVD